MTKREAYIKWIEADAKWSALLKAQFGKKAGDVRYTKAGEGQEGSELHKAYKAFREGMAEYYAA